MSFSIQPWTQQALFSINSHDSVCIKKFCQNPFSKREKNVKRKKCHFVFSLVFPYQQIEYPQFFVSPHIVQMNNANISIFVLLASQNRFLDRKNIPVWKFLCEITSTNPSFLSSFLYKTKKKKWLQILIPDKCLG